MQYTVFNFPLKELREYDIFKPTPYFMKTYVPFSSQYAQVCSEGLAISFHFPFFLLLLVSHSFSFLFFFFLSFFFFISTYSHFFIFYFFLLLYFVVPLQVYNPWAPDSQSFLYVTSAGMFHTPLVGSR
jgi:hypothetical protein